VEVSFPRGADTPADGDAAYSELGGYYYHSLLPCLISFAIMAVHGGGELPYIIDSTYISSLTIPHIGIIILSAFEALDRHILQSSITVEKCDGITR